MLFGQKMLDNKRSHLTTTKLYKYVFAVGLLDLRLLAVVRRDRVRYSQREGTVNCANTQKFLIRWVKTLGT